VSAPTVATVRKRYIRYLLTYAERDPILRSVSLESLLVKGTVRVVAKVGAHGMNVVRFRDRRPVIVREEGRVRSVRAWP